MTSVGKMCLYCSKPIAADDRVAACDRCFAAHHEACWDRNGRCSTFRCAGLPKTMRGDDLPTALQIALERANEQPQICPLCANKVYAGVLQGQRSGKQANGEPNTGLLFFSRQKPKGGLLARMRAPKSWFLPGGHIKSRSCGKCRRLFIWGVLVNDEFVDQCQEEGHERYCPHCATVLTPGEIALKQNAQGGARFECADAPDFHDGWFAHNVLDRYFFSKWTPALTRLPASSCPDCHYTEIAGRPIYRFL